MPRPDTTTTRQLVDPLTAYPRPPFPAQTQELPGDVDLIEAEGRRGIAVPGDLQDEAHCRRVVEQARDEFGRVDVLVNNAAFQERREAIEEIATDEWEQTL